MRTHPLKSIASGPLKIEKGTHPVFILATHRHTTESVVIPGYAVGLGWIITDKQKLIETATHSLAIFSTIVHHSCIINKGFLPVGLL